MKEKVLIISKNQFGYLTDVYKWCEYLRMHYDISVICFNQGFPKISMEDVVVSYHTSKLPKIIRGAFFLLISIIRSFFHKGKILVVYFDKCEIIQKVCRSKKIHLDIRTVSVSTDKKVREKSDLKLINASKYFTSISVISEGLKYKLGLSDDVYVLPLGADVISNTAKKYDSLNLLYVGTFNQRNIEETITGISVFVNKNPHIKIKYDIVGDGNHNESALLLSYINKYGLNDIVELHGRVPYTSLLTYFNQESHTFSRAHIFLYGRSSSLVYHSMSFLYAATIYHLVLLK